MYSRRRKIAHARALTLSGIAVLVSPAIGFAAMTPVDAVGNNTGAERCLAGTICPAVGTYAGTLSIIHILENDTGLTASRVDDDLDAIWQNTIDMGGMVMARARYGADTNKLGYDAGAGYQFLSNSVDNGKVVVTSAAAYFGDTMPSDFVIDPSLDWVTIPVATNVDFAFILFDTSTNTKWTANDSGDGVASAGYANSTNLDDHMVTFRLTSNHYLIGWEDRPLSGAGSVDLDYNDFVAEVMFVQPVPVPVPAAAWMLGSALIAGLGVPRRRRGKS